MSKFGWSLPPGCSTLPGEEECGPHPKSEELFDLLERAGVTQDIIDKATAIVDELAGTVEFLANRECPHCEARRTEAERKSCEDFKNDPNAEDRA